MKGKAIKKKYCVICITVLASLFLILSSCDVLSDIFGGGGQDGELIVGTGGLTSIQDAIDNAVDGDTIIVLPGTYKESINFDGKDITLRSATQKELEDMDWDFPGDPADFDIVAETIIDGDGASEVIALDSGEERDAVIRGLTIKGGGIGIYIRAGSQAEIIDNIIENNSDGGIHLVADSSTADASDTPSKATITGNTIRNNVRTIGAGIYLGHYSEAVIEDNTITENTATTTSTPRGGGAIGTLSHKDHTINTEIRNNVITDNVSYRAGGGIFLDRSGETTVITGNVISGNEADPDADHHHQASGGGIYIDYCRKVTIYDNDFSNNKTHWRGGAMVVIEGKTYGDETTLMTELNYDDFNDFEGNTVVDTDPDHPESHNIYLDED